MKIFSKVNIIQLFLFWRNLAISLMVVLAVLAFSSILPSYFSPLVSLLGAGFLYNMIYLDRMTSSSSCMLIVYSTFLCLLTYTIVIILINLLDILHLVNLPQEILFVGSSFVSSLILMPVCMFVYLFLYCKQHTFTVCTQCKMRKGDMYSRGKLGFILNQESNFQLRNMLIIFTSLSAIVWTYYLLFFVKVNLNSRDNYIFIWLDILIILIDELYFVFRYYNLYIDLQEHDEILTSEEIQNLKNQNYLRFYVICGNRIYVQNDVPSIDDPDRKVIDTPFFYKVAPDMIGNEYNIKKMIEEKTGVENGELRFFYRQTNSAGYSSYTIERYFYFLDSEAGQCPQLAAPGVWEDYETIKSIYSTNPLLLATLSITDTTRLATIILTEKMFDENGNRKFKLKKYRPTFNLIDVRKSSLDFQDNKWIKISMFNSDVRFYKLKRFWYKMMHNITSTKQTWN